MSKEIISAWLAVSDASIVRDEAAAVERWELKLPHNRPWRNLNDLKHGVVDSCFGEGQRKTHTCASRQRGQAD
ncbi:hypothetical protein [Cupriavidus necator]|uniref:hypothetical protein n=1 Tax=Cupriavidus necator TaxID=106590 RepID=UPI000A882E3D|nr:hypothetical protein [Cupriavidus necator]